MKRGRLLIFTSSSILTMLVTFLILGATASIYAEQPSAISLPPKVKLLDIEPTGVYANWVAKARFEDLPPEIIDQSKRLILDTLACMIGALGEDDIIQPHQYIKELGGKPQARVVYFGTKVPVSQAAFVNAVMARSLDLGDVESEATHSSEYIFPTILTAGDYLHSNGKDFITAMALGTEILARMSHGVFAASMGLYQLYRLPPFVQIAVIYAAGKLYGLSSEQLWDAAGLGLACPSSMDWQSGPEGRVTGKKMMHGFVAQDAITCVNLARMGGIVATRKVFFGERGIVQSLYPYKYDPDIFTKDIGKLWIADLNLKKYPACLWIHAPLEGTFELVKENKIELQDINSLEYETGFEGIVEPKEEKWNPQTMGAAQFSLPYVVATGLITGKFFLDDYTKAALARKDVHELMKKIKGTYNPELSKKVQGNCKIKITLKDGRIYGKDVIYPPGHPKKPLTWDDLVYKFKVCADYVKFPKDRQEKIIGVVYNLEKLKDISKLVDLLVVRK